MHSKAAFFTSTLPRLPGVSTVRRFALFHGNNFGMRLNCFILSTDFFSIFCFRSAVDTRSKLDERRWITYFFQVK